MLRAGFRRYHIGVYYMIGQPGQSFDDCIDSLSLASSLGVSPIPLSYSLIPGTEDFRAAQARGEVPSPYDPLMSNKELFLYRPAGIPRSTMKEIMRLARLVRNFSKYNMNLFGGDAVTNRFRFALSGGLEDSLAGVSDALSRASGVQFSPEIVGALARTIDTVAAGPSSQGRGLDPCGRISEKPFRAAFATQTLQRSADVTAV
jgi:hypothetical protein